MLDITGAVAWRQPGVHYHSNEAYLDLVETVSVQLAPDGARAAPDWLAGRRSSWPCTAAGEAGSCRWRVPPSLASARGPSSRATLHPASPAILGGPGHAPPTHISAGPGLPPPPAPPHPPVTPCAGQVLSAEVLGAINMECRLSGMPECRLGLNDALSLQQGGVRACRRRRPACRRACRCTRPPSAGPQHWAAGGRACCRARA
jgi:hypothetical protein